MATTFYVNVNNPNPVAPYTNWATAATNIVDVTDGAYYGDLVLVSNGVYHYGSSFQSGDGGTRLYVEGFTVQSVNGPAVTTIVGNPTQDSTAQRCAVVANGAALIGFTLESGGTSTNWSMGAGPVPPWCLGGGVLCAFGNAIVSNCIIVSNSALVGAGAASDNSGYDTIDPPAALSLVNCQMVGNAAAWNAGGASDCTLSNCSLNLNSAGAFSGGGASNCTLYNCILTANSAIWGGGLFDSIAYNSVLTGNHGSSLGGGAYYSTLFNCTVAGNSSGTGGGCYKCTVQNSIVWSNAASTGSNYYVLSNAAYSCTAPLPSGTGNIASDPRFVTGTTALFRLQSNSPCINAGNNVFAVGPTDLAGNGRISGGTVDIGAYEFSTIHYVNANGANPVAPFTNWATAATTIQNALNAATNGDFVIVTNGIYQTGGAAGYRANAVNPVNLQSVNGPAATVIVGAGMSCVYLTNGSTLSGFTLTNGTSSGQGGGLYCDGPNIQVSNCVLTGNSAASGGGARGGTFSNCTFIGNTATQGGAVIGLVTNGLDAPATFACWLNNCLLVSNTAAFRGGAVWDDTNSGCYLANCTLIANTVNSSGVTLVSGGAVYAAVLSYCTVASNGVFANVSSGGGACRSTLDHCLIFGNQSISGNGGGVDSCFVSNSIISNNTSSAEFYSFGSGAVSSVLVNCQVLNNTSPNMNATAGVYGCSLANCLVAGNSAGSIGSIGGAQYCTLSNCTITANFGDGVGGAANCTLYNCIVVSNFAGPNTPTNWDADTFSYSCASPLPPGPGNISADPLFVSFGTGNYRLQSNSPCINAGNSSYAYGAADLDGNARVFGGVVDMGAYEFTSPIIHYVNVNNATPAAPYTSWPAAAATIQDAVDAATNGDIVLVTNGVYSAGGRAASIPTNDLTANRVLVTLPITVESVNGPAVTIIQGVPGFADPGAVRCAYLSNGASLSGFTLTSGSVTAESPPSSFTSAISDMDMPGNADWKGGALFCADTNEIVSNCIICSSGALFGGGVWKGTLYNCLLYSNIAVSNIQVPGTGLLFDVAGTGGGAAESLLFNCTVTANWNYGTTKCTDRNSIVYADMNGFDATLSSFNYCCTSPAASGVGNITNSPIFVDAAHGNYRLQSNSPCINAGNNAYVSGATDLDSNPRISGGTVDIGAYEFQNPASTISYAWLQQFGLPIDGSADNLDSDGDGLSNYQEWRAGTDPTNAASVLQLANPVTSGTNLVVTWQSVTNVNYYLLRSASLASGSFLPLATNIPGQPGTTSYTDTNAPPPGPWFYRVGVQ